MDGLTHQLERAVQIGINLANKFTLTNKCNTFSDVFFRVSYNILFDLVTQKAAQVHARDHWPMNSWIWRRISGGQKENESLRQSVTLDLKLANLRNHTSSRPQDTTTTHYIVGDALKDWPQRAQWKRLFA